jgi:hypothetical protein
MPKPPPVYVTGVQNNSPMIQLSEQIAKEQYEIKALADNQVKVQPKIAVLQRAFLKTLLLQNHVFNLSSDYSPFLITLTVDRLNQEREPILSNGHTNWDDFRCLVNERLTSSIPFSVLSFHSCSFQQMKSFYTGRK